MAKKKGTRKAATLKTARPQSGGSNPVKDKFRNAKPAGWRLSKAGKWYYENRRNRSDDTEEIERNKVYKAWKEAEKKAKSAANSAHKRAVAAKKKLKMKAKPKAKPSAKKRNTKQGTLF